jgi:hypothetical protein
MAVSTIPLAKGLDLSKMEWPALLSIKKDGVPIKISIHVVHDCFTFDAVSRDDKHLGGPSADVSQFFCCVAHADLAQGTHTFVFEITDTVLKNFKDISGKAKRKAPQDGLLYSLFDYHWSGEPDAPFHSRIQQGARLVRDSAPSQFDVLDQYPLGSVEDAEKEIKHMQATLPDEEGFVLVHADRTFKPNSRHWDYQKIVVDPMHDLQVVGFEEAISKDGEPLRMVGRINVKYKGEVTGCGPGKLTHKERRQIWELYVLKTALGPDPSGALWPERASLIATIKAKRDPSYAMMRQPTFQHWREDKDEPNECV